LEISERTFQIASKLNHKKPAAQVRDAEALRQAEFGDLAGSVRTAAKALTISFGRNARLFAAAALARAGDKNPAQELANELRTQLLCLPKMSKRLRRRFEVFERHRMRVH